MVFNFLRRPEWTLTLPNICIDFEVINGTILHSSFKGVLDEEALQASGRLRERVRLDVAPDANFDYLVVRFDGKTRYSSGFPHMFQRSMNGWHDQHPVKLYVLYGSAAWRGLVRLERASFAFPLRAARDLNDALTIIGRDMNGRERPQSQEGGRTELIEDQMDELVRYVESLDGMHKDESPGTGASLEQNPVLDGIHLIKHELSNVLESHHETVEELRRNEEKYRKVVESIQDGYAEVDLRGRFTFCTEEVYRLLGYTEEELARMGYKDILSRNERYIAYQVFEELYRGRAPGSVISLNVSRKNGSTVFLEISFSAMRDASGHMIGMRCLARDTTERRRIENEKRRLEQRLEQAERMEVVGTLAGGVAHDLNNLLTSIVSYPDVLLFELSDDSSLRAPLLMMQRAGEKAARIVQDLLILSRRDVRVTERFNINDLVEDVVRSSELQALKRGHANIEVETRIQPHPTQVTGSRSHLSRALMNLLLNAVESMPDGGSVIISTERGRQGEPGPDSRGAMPGEHVVLTVRDTGPGISERDMARIFEPFYMKRIGRGTGSGLSMPVVWGAVKDHGGLVDVQSQIGEGTTFRLCLPSANDEGSAKREQEAVENIVGHGELVLVVDDVEDQRVVARHLLEKLGYAVVVASSGEEGVSIVERQAVDLVVLDMLMEPGIDGLETYKRIREVRPEQRAIIASGYSESERVRETQKLGAGGYVRKPYLMETIGVAVKKELERA